MTNIEGLLKTLEHLKLDELFALFRMIEGKHGIRVSMKIISEPTEQELKEKEG
jgi:hypothetical protein